MIAYIDKWGNSMGFRIPAMIVKKLDLHAGGSVHLDLVEDRLIIMKNKTLTLEYLVGQITPDNRHAECLTNGLKKDVSVGHEVW